MTDLMQQTWTNEAGDALRAELDGPWRNEPDKGQWVDAETGLDCLIVRGPQLSLCGYVGVPAGHPWHGVEFMEIEHIRTSLSFSDRCHEDMPMEASICHVPREGQVETDVWWLGFDCGHTFDLCPRYYTQEYREALGSLADPPAVNGVGRWGETYKTWGYVVEKCQELAAQVLGAV